MKNKWSGLKKATPWGPWSELPPVTVVAWLWLISCCDNAASNRRMHAQMEVAALKMRPRVLVAYSACMLHLIHRCIVPLLQHHNVLNGLYRLTHVWIVGTYFSCVCRKVRRVIKTSVFVTHSDEGATPSDRMLSEHVLFLTLCEAKPLEHLSRTQRELRDELLKHMVGNWVSSKMKYKCFRANCVGGAECLKFARAHVLSMFYRACLCRGIQIPVASRWWKACPIARQTLFGICFHNVIPRSVPCYARAGDDPWHQLHSWRVRASFEYLNKALTAEHLSLLLCLVGPSHFIMAWLMKHESDVRRLGSSPASPQSRRSVLLEFINPVTSPAGTALALGAAMLTNDGKDKYWATLFRFSVRAEQDSIKDIWKSLLPCLALIFWRVRGAIEGWPMKLLRFLILTCVVSRRSLAAEFASLKRCCCPRGIYALLLAVMDHPEKCLEDWFQKKIKIK